ncbi:MAG: DUF1738 domain-containing protein [Planctomycetaceae bacterium]|nr:DUF1738 domain-containing protein [Planctomycetaceae bacterium]
MTTTTQRTDVYTRVTDKIIADLTRGVRPWHRPWQAEYAAGRITRPLRHNGEPYHGVNILMLWAEAEQRGLACPYWLTFQQAKQLGGHVRKGEKGSTVVYASSFQKTETGTDGQEIEETIPFLKQYTVFNAEQCEGLPERYSELAETPRDDLQPVERVSSFVAETGAEVRTGGTRAYYAIGGDYIQMPPLPTFRDAESHAGTLLHELTHFTRHPSRLDRDLGRKRFGDAGYAMEELVAELGAAFLCADLGVTPEVREDHASYIDSWLQVLQQDKRAIFTAASHASKAVDYLHSLQPQVIAQ